MPCSRRIGRATRGTRCLGALSPALSVRTHLSTQPLKGILTTQSSSHQPPASIQVEEQLSFLSQG